MVQQKRKVKKRGKVGIVGRTKHPSQLQPHESNASEDQVASGMASVAYHSIGPIPRSRYIASGTWPLDYMSFWKTSSCLPEPSA